MSNPVDREGTFRGLIKEYSLVKGTKTKSLGVSVAVALEELREGAEWFPWAEYDMVATGVVNVIKGDGQLNQNGLRSLMENAGWDGDFATIVDGTWQPTRCQVVVATDTYNGENRLKVSFINGYDDAPRGGGNVNDDDLRQLKTQYGAQIRALGASAKRNAKPAAAGKPAAPPPPPKPQPVAAATNADADIPF